MYFRINCKHTTIICLHLDEKQIKIKIIINTGNVEFRYYDKKYQVIE